MEALLHTLVDNTNGLGAYLTVLGILVACGLGVPLPEDISLILGGFLVHKGAAELPLMMAVGMAGILLGDSLIFWAGRKLGSTIGQRPGGLVGRVLTPEKRARVQALFLQHGEKIVMIARFLPGVRAVTYFTAGSTGMSYGRFVFFDGVAALVSAPVFVFLGYYFGGELDKLITALKQGQVRVMVGVGLVVLSYLAFRWWRRRRARAQGPAQPSTMVPLAVEAPLESGEKIPPPVSERGHGAQG